MASEMRRIAQSLVQSRAASFTSRHPRAESEARARAALAPIEPTRLRLESRWSEDAAGPRLDVDFLPAPRTQRFLQITSLVLIALVAASVFAVMSEGVGRTLGFLVPLTTVLALLALPFVVAAFGAQREAEEASIRRALKRALMDEDESGGGRSR
jgi:hypothetical protein